MIKDDKTKDCVCPTDMTADGSDGCIANPYGDGGDDDSTGTTGDAATTTLSPNAAAAAAVTSVSSSSDTSTDDTTFVPGAVRARARVAALTSTGQLGPRQRSGHACRARLVRRLLALNSRPPPSCHLFPLSSIPTWPSLGPYPSPRTLVAVPRFTRSLHRKAESRSTTVCGCAEIDK